DPPVQVTNTVGGLRKLFPLTVMVCKLFDPVTGLGLTLVICGAVPSAVAGEPSEVHSSQLQSLMRTVQLSALVEVLMVICTWLPFTKFTSREVTDLDPPVQVTNTVGGLRKLFPLTVMVCKLFDPVTGLGLTLVICGAVPSPLAGE